MAIEDSVAQDQIRAFVERIERMEEEKKALSEDIKEIYAEARGNGFDVKILRRVVGIRKQDANERMEQEAILELYMSALGMCAALPARDDERDRLNSLAAKVEVSLRRAAPVEKPDALAALKANPALAVVDVANLKKSEPQPAPQAGSDLTTLPCASGQVADIQPETANDESEAQKVERRSPKPEDAGSIPATLANAGSSNGRTAAFDAVNAGSTPAPATTYPTPGEVYWENTPREPVHRHKYSEAFGSLGSDAYVIDDDISKAQSAAIVMIGDTILDGWARYLCARNTRGLDGQTAFYPAYQYDGTDPLLDCIRWNVEGRILNDDQLRLIAKRLVTLEPKRKADIFKAMGFGMELVQ